MVDGISIGAVCCSARTQRRVIQLSFRKAAQSVNEHGERALLLRQAVDLLLEFVYWSLALTFSAVSQFEFRE
jgi:hypothetical protein